MAKTSPSTMPGKLSCRPMNFLNYANYKGKTLITTDGSTLLGADDKAGVAEIMTAIEYLVQHPDIPHGPFALVSPRTKKWAGGQTTLTWKLSTLTLPTPWMAAKSAI